MLDIRRRQFVTLLGGAAAWPIAARGQQTQVLRKLAILSDGSEATNRAGAALVRQVLERAGWSEGRNVQTKFGWGDGGAERISSLAVEIVKTSPDVILAWGETGLIALLNETRSIPIVFIFADPIASGLITNMAHPGGNATGFLSFEPEIATKWLELLKQLVPSMRRLLVLTSRNPSSTRFLATIEKVIGSFAVDMMPAPPVANAADIIRAIETAAREPQTAMIVLPGSFTNSHRELIVGLAERYRLPAIYGGRDIVEVGGLMAYGSVRTELYRLSAEYVDRILKGEKSADLPVQTPTKYELVINLKTAGALGLSVPPTLLAIATDVIE
jgi:putative ABC transport system substrate-binding protein